MASSFPSSIDAFPDPLANSPLNAPSHSALHQDVNDAVEKVEVKLGLGASPASGASAGQVLKSSGSGNTAWSDIVVGDIDATGRAVNDVIVADGAGNAAWSGAAGLWLVKTQTVGTAVSSVTVSDAFNATYQNYRISYSGGTQSANADLGIRLGASTTGYFGYLVYGVVTSATVLGAGNNNTASWAWIGGGAAGQASLLACDLYAPNLAAHTKIRNGAYQQDNAYGTMQGEHRVATAYSDFTIIVSTGTLTGGTIRVYGYRN